MEEAMSVYITTPIYYVNDLPHIGHACTTVCADVLARYHRLFCKKVHFLTGTDEHGQKVQQSARLRGTTPEVLCDETSAAFRSLWKRLDISQDDFIRTTEPRHTDGVTRALDALYASGDIYKGEYHGAYCTPCERFIGGDTEDSPCPDRGRAVQAITEPAWFFRQSRYQEWLVDHIEQHPDFVIPSARREELLGFLRRPLTDLCISRPKSRVSWGVELPFDPEFTCYVWVDALLNYITAVGYDTDLPRLREWWPAHHVLAKDIITTHGVYWPILLKALGYAVPKTLVVHGWLLSRDSKVSKSRGNAVDPIKLCDTHGVEAVRYYLAAEFPFKQDVSFSEESLVRRYNTDLANNIGNLASRVGSLIRKRCDGLIPEHSGLQEEDRVLRDAVRASADTVRRHIECWRVEGAVAEITGISSRCNRYLETTAPWKLPDTRKGSVRTREIVRAAGESLRIIAGLLHPVLPKKSSLIRTALGLCGDAPEWGELSRWDVLQPGTRVVDPGPVFPRITRGGEFVDQGWGI